jgi:hypothetical protein
MSGEALAKTEVLTKSEAFKAKEGNLMPKLNPHSAFRIH